MVRVVVNKAVEKESKKGGLVDHASLKPTIHMVIRQFHDNILDIVEFAPLSFEPYDMDHQVGNHAAEEEVSHGGVNKSAPTIPRHVVFVK
jgi:hypothetical protein